MTQTPRRARNAFRRFLSPASSESASRSPPTPPPERGDSHARTIKGGMSSRPSWGQHQYEAATSRWRRSERARRGGALKNTNAAPFEPPLRLLTRRRVISHAPGGVTTARVSRRARLDRDMTIKHVLSTRRCSASHYTRRAKSNATLVRHISSTSASAPPATTATRPDRRSVAGPARVRTGTGGGSRLGNTRLASFASSVASSVAS